MKRVGLVDADLLCYTAAAVGQDAHDLDFDDGPLVETDPDAAREYIETMLAGWRQKMDLDVIALCWSDPDRGANWRLSVLPTYKHNRTGVKPELYWELHDELRADKRTESHTLAGLEGDDVLGILQTGPFGRRNDTVILSADKDMRTVPGELYDWFHDDHVFITPDEAAHFHMTQTLTGDQVDGYKGLPRCGPVRAKAVLDGLTGYTELWPAVVDEYERRGFPAEDALVQARVSRILHRSDWDAANRRPILWLPPLGD